MGNDKTKLEIQRKVSSHLDHAGKIKRDLERLTRNAIFMNRDPDGSRAIKLDLENPECQDALEDLAISGLTEQTRSLRKNVMDIKERLFALEDAKAINQMDDSKQSEFTKWCLSVKEKAVKATRCGGFYVKDRYVGRITQKPDGAIEFADSVKAELDAMVFIDRDGMGIPKIR